MRCSLGSTGAITCDYGLVSSREYTIDSIEKW